MIRLLVIFFIFLVTIVSAEEKIPQMVFIRAGTVMTNLKTNKTVILSEGIKANVLPDDPIKKTYFIVYDKKGKARFKINSHDINDLIEDIKMLPDVDASTNYPPVSDFKKEDNKYIFETQTIFHVDNVQMKELNSVYSSDINMAFAPRYEIRNFYTNNLPIKVGVTINYQTIYWQTEAENFKLSNVSTGPILKYDFSSNDDYIFSATLSGEVSLDCRTTSVQSNDVYSATIFNLGVENEWNTEYGKISLGANYRKHQMSLTKSSNSSLSLNNTLITLNSFGMMLGYRFDWEL